MTICSTRWLLRMLAEFVTEMVQGVKLSRRFLETWGIKVTYINFEGYFGNLFLVKQADYTAVTVLPTGVRKVQIEELAPSPNLIAITDKTEKHFFLNGD